MKLQFKIAKHFWEGGKNARWFVSESFDRNILTWLKKEYSKLEELKPKNKKFGKSTIFLFYTDGQDVYGRNITEIIAVFVDASFTSIEHIRDLIAYKIAGLSPLILDFTLVVKKSYITDIQKANHVGSQGSSKSKFFKVLFFFTGLALITAVIAVAFLFSVLKNNKQVNSDKTITRTEDSKHPAPEQIMTNAEIPILQEDSPEVEKTSVQDKFCEKYLKMLNTNSLNIVGEKCFLSYIEDQCVNRSDRKSYKEWIQENKSNIKCEYVRDPIKDKDLKIWTERHSGIKNLTKDFFSGKE